MFFSYFMFLHLCYELCKNDWMGGHDAGVWGWLERFLLFDFCLASAAVTICDMRKPQAPYRRAVYRITSTRHRRLRAPWGGLDALRSHLALFAFARLGCGGGGVHMAGSQKRSDCPILYVQTFDQTKDKSWRKLLFLSNFPMLSPLGTCQFITTRTPRRCLTPPPGGRSTVGWSPVILPVSLQFRQRGPTPGCGEARDKDAIPGERENVTAFRKRDRGPRATPLPKRCHVKQQGSSR